MAYLPPDGCLISCRPNQQPQLWGRGRWRHRRDVRLGGQPHAGSYLISSPHALPAPRHFRVAQRQRVGLGVGSLTQRRIGLPWAEILTSPPTWCGACASWKSSPKVRTNGIGGVEMGGDQPFGPSLGSGPPPTTATPPCTRGSWIVNYKAEANNSDWSSHCNSIAYNADLDQIMVSSREFNELWIIDHSVPNNLTVTPQGSLDVPLGQPRSFRRYREKRTRPHPAQPTRRALDPGRSSDGVLQRQRAARRASSKHYAEAMTPAVSIADGTYTIDPTASLGAPEGSDHGATRPSLDSDFFSQNTSGAPATAQRQHPHHGGRWCGEKCAKSPSTKTWCGTTSTRSGRLGPPRSSATPILNAVFRAERYPAAVPGIGWTRLVGQMGFWKSPLTLPSASFRFRSRPVPPISQRQPFRRNRRLAGPGLTSLDACVILPQVTFDASDGAVGIGDLVGAC